ncbi:hypothetical protein TCAL_16012 [Tigriopus californicus]|uniref:Uncharacterized protein n=1 Tax=Tigriopus californicus TaxID=6832 RepID=A0A553PQM6_TIGCA|nr:uncharacterized protein LOC131882800 [Tigriopus californicus]TRY79966.1 hypothetical protein TCAL_16012 [Tigriopus californicus]
MHQPTKLLILGLLGLIFISTMVHAYPRTRTSKYDRQASGRLANIIRNEKPACERNVPCGWALYHTRSSSALRPIYEYTKNTYCHCNLSSKCVYKENRSEMRAFVFYCREDDNNEMYQFPDHTT